MSRRVQLVSQAVEEALARRVSAPFALAARSVERVAFGIQAIDAGSHGGAPLGAITELVGSASSGRTTAALGLLRHLTSMGSVCAWVDVADTLSPESAAASGVDLSRLLWIRCRAEVSEQPVLSSLLPGISTSAKGDFSPTRSTCGGSPHPRSEGRNMPQAIEAMLGQHGGLLDHQLRREHRAIGTPGAPNRPLTASASGASPVSGVKEDRQEQVSTDRLPSRRRDPVDVSARCAEPQPRRVVSLASSKRAILEPARRTSPRDLGHGKPWPELDRALQATDLLLSNGGFAAIVLDIGSTPVEFASRIPMATWFRYRAACERSRASLVLLTQSPCAHTTAGLVVRLQPGTVEAVGPLMTGVRFTAIAERIRFTEQHARVVPIRKPPQSHRPESWKSEMVWG